MTPTPPTASGSSLQGSSAGATLSRSAYILAGNSDQTGTTNKAQAPPGSLQISRQKTERGGVSHIALTNLVAPQIRITPLPGQEGAVGLFTQIEFRSPNPKTTKGERARSQHRTTESKNMNEDSFTPVEKTLAIRMASIVSGVIGRTLRENSVPLNDESEQRSRRLVTAMTLGFIENLRGEPAGMPLPTQDLWMGCTVLQVLKDAWGVEFEPESPEERRAKFELLN